MQADPTPRVVATESAVAEIERLRAAHGPLMFFQSGGCCDGSSPICLKDGELPPSPHDLRLGEIGRSSFYIDADQYRRWREPELLIDVSDGPAEGFSLEGLVGVHFVAHTRTGTS